MGDSLSYLDDLLRSAPWCILPFMINVIILLTKKPKEIVVYLDAFLSSFLGI